VGGACFLMLFILILLGQTLLCLVRIARRLWMSLPVVLSDGCILWILCRYLKLNYWWFVDFCSNVLNQKSEPNHTLCLIWASLSALPLLMFCDAAPPINLSKFQNFSHQSHHYLPEPLYPTTLLSRSCTCVHNYIMLSHCLHHQHTR
jgi:hypothetical protein